MTSSFHSFHAWHWRKRCTGQCGWQVRTTTSTGRQRQAEREGQKMSKEVPSAVSRRSLNISSLDLQSRKTECSSRQQATAPKCSALASTLVPQVLSGIYSHLEVFFMLRVSLESMADTVLSVLLFIGSMTLVKSFNFFTPVVWIHWLVCSSS